MDKSTIQKKHTLICVIIFSIHTCVRVQYKKNICVCAICYY